MSFFEKLLSHFDNPAIAHLKSMFSDTVSTLQDFETHVKNTLNDVTAAMDEVKSVVESMDARNKVLEEEIGIHDTPAPAAPTKADPKPKS